MKSTKFLVLGLVLSIGLLFSCSKEEMALNKLAGKWKIEKSIYNGVEQTLPSTYIMYLTFGDCKKGTTCSLLSSQSTDGGATYNDISENFTLSTDGKQVITDDGITTIDKLTKTDLHLSRVSDDSTSIAFELKKQ